MRIIENKLLPPKGFSAINLFGIVFVHYGTRLSERTIRHESIHTKQMQEMLFIFFYLWYVVEWLVRLVGCGFKAKKAYRNILFEREAYNNDTDLEYLNSRRLFSWLR